MSNCLRCGENEATVCVPCVNEVAESSQPSAEWNSVVEALNKLWEGWNKYGPDDDLVQQRMTQLLQLYDDWLG